ncbi:hypothetical protein T09_3593 [Trichinella sp. T9]|nr:hypothetical protein T09_3593 [Trichinella sp. T9]
MNQLRRLGLCLTTAAIFLIYTTSQSEWNLRMLCDDEHLICNWMFHKFNCVRRKIFNSWQHNAFLKFQ